MEAEPTSVLRAMVVIIHDKQPNLISFSLQEVLEVRWEWYCMRDHFHGATLPAGHTLHVISKHHCQGHRLYRWGVCYRATYKARWAAKRAHIKMLWL